MVVYALSGGGLVVFGFVAGWLLRREFDLWYRHHRGPVTLDLTPEKPR